MARPLPLRMTAPAQARAARRMQAMPEYVQHRAEALRRLELIRAAISGEVADVNWGHVGSMQYVVELLGQAGHAAGVAELTER